MEKLKLPIATVTTSLAKEKAISTFILSGWKHSYEVVDKKTALPET